MSDSVHKGWTSEKKSSKIQVLPEEQTNDKFGRLAGNVGISEANNNNQKAVEQQLIHGQDVE